MLQMTISSKFTLHSHNFNYTLHTLERRQSFVPSIDGLACKEATAYEKRIASLLASKWERQYSEMVGFVRSKMSISLIRSNTMMMQGSRSSKRFVGAIQSSAEFEAIESIPSW